MATVLVIASAIITALNVYLTVRNVRVWRRMNEKPLPIVTQQLPVGSLSLGPGAHQFGAGGPVLHVPQGWVGGANFSGKTSGPAPGWGFGNKVQIHGPGVEITPVEDLTAPDEEEDVILTGWKRFDVSNGFLVSPVSGYVWHSPRLTASCPQLYNLGIGPEACTAAVPKHLQDPSAAHNCGIFAMKDPKDLNDPAYRRPIEAIAKVSLFGIVQEGTEGYAAEKCIIEEVYLPTGGKPIDGDEIEQLLYRYNVPVKEESPWT